MRWSSLGCVLVLLLPLLLPRGAAGGDLPEFSNEAWRSMEIPSVDVATRYSVHEGVLRAESSCGASAMALSLRSANLATTPLLSWQWRIERGLDVADERSRGGDDFAARVIVMFEYDGDQATFVERTRHRVAEVLRGEEVPGRSLAYVWSSRQEPGSAWPNPFRSPTVLISQGRGGSSPWRSVQVDLRADYREHWKAEAPPLFGLAILTDADNTCGEAVAEYRDFRLSAPQSEAD